ncbi:MAG: GlsB/YeaQ/YmgE family stress response membrane protein [Bacteroidaceae bacterium]|nr:GlsB/YeaQ/YmgE family stress response membrane protein [Bacteroidaceae bacterium]
MIIGIISGIIAGFIAAKLTDGEGKGCIVDLFLGLVGGCFGGWLFEQFGIAAYSWVGQIITAVVGASILLWLWNKLK